jgi:hypothetical protein
MIKTFDSSIAVGLLIWYELWIYSLWPFEKYELSIGYLIGGLW